MEAMAPARDRFVEPGEPVPPQDSARVHDLRQERRQRESLSESFHDEIEAWARHALTRNGFGDF